MFLSFFIVKGLYMPYVAPQLDGYKYMLGWLMNVHLSCWTVAYFLHFIKLQQPVDKDPVELVHFICTCPQN